MKPEPGVAGATARPDNAHHAVPGARGGQSRWARFVDLSETYGEHVLRDFLVSIPAPAVALDIGAGSGRDLELIRERSSGVRRIGLDCNEENLERLRERGIEAHALNLERQPLPLPDASIDLVIANQVLEHTKEIFWIVHEVTRVLRVGGHFLIGVPNVCAFHNRMLMLLGRHPTQYKSYSAHVRPFSKRDTVRFMEVCWSGGYELERFAGSQFYPLPASLSRIACALAPAAAVTIFFLFRKTTPYGREFLEHPVKGQLETNFYLGGGS